MSGLGLVAITSRVVPSGKISLEGKYSTM
uniref:Uncharacterized protein n=1 Tax=Arundo donax TaxID=35708 RepID=A0A0A9DTH9_ARUDO